MYKKLKGAVALIISALFTLAACGSSSEDEKTLYNVSATGLVSGLTLQLKQRTGNGSDAVIEDLQDNKIKEGYMLSGIFTNTNEASYEFTVKMGDVPVEQFLGNEIPAKENGKSGTASFTVPAASDNITIAISESETVYYTVTINNGASEANVKDESVNAIHVYPTTTRRDYIEGENQVKAGTKIKAYVYNYASAVRLEVEQDGKEKIVKTYPPITPFEDDDKIDILSFTVNSNIKFTTFAIDEEETVIPLGSTEE